MLPVFLIVWGPIRSVDGTDGALVLRVYLCIAKPLVVHHNWDKYYIDAPRHCRGVLIDVCVHSKSKYSKNPVVEQHVGWLMAPADLVSTPTPSPSTHPGMERINGARKS